MRKNVSEFDLYNRMIEENSYSDESTINVRRLIKYDEYGRIVQDGIDRDLNGKFNAGDNWRDTVYNGPGQVYKAIDHHANGKVSTNIWEYDALGRRDYTFADTNSNEQWDNKETKKVDIYHGDSSVRDEVRSFIAPDNENPTHILKFIYLNAGTQGTIIGTLEATKGKEFHSLHHSVYGSVVSSNEDYTTENWHRFFDKVGGNIKTIYMSDARAKTEITLDNDVLRKITTGSQLRIAGDSTDVVNLKDSHEFKKLDNIKKAFNQEYNQYTTEVDGQQYTLLIDTDINVVLA